MLCFIERFCIDERKLRMDIQNTVQNKLFSFFNWSLLEAVSPHQHTATQLRVAMFNVREDGCRRRRQVVRTFTARSQTSTFFF